MHLEGIQRIGADRATVWAALNDPAVLMACIPGCQSLEADAEGGFSAVVKQKVGPVSATFRGRVSLSDLNPPESYRIAGKGEGGAAGFASGGADVRLAEIEGGTELSYAAEAKVGGKIAQLGARLIDGFARKMADDFFGRFKATVEAQDPDAAGRFAEAEAARALADAGPDDDAPAAAEPAKPGLWKRITG